MPGLGSDIQDWIRSLPLFTTFWFGGTLLFTLLGRFSLLFGSWLILTWETVISKFVFQSFFSFNTKLLFRFQIWRPFTALVYFPLSPLTGFRFLINLYYLYNYRLHLYKKSLNGCDLFAKNTDFRETN